jgi:hypothetical protein
MTNEHSMHLFSTRERLSRRCDCLDDPAVGHAQAVASRLIGFLPVPTPPLTM